jgi:hypothetical protein
MLIFIPAIANHRPVVEISISRLKRKYQNANFLIVCPLVEQFSDLGGENIQIAADAEYAPISKLELALILSPEKKHLVNWYYQQLLKYAVIAKSHERRILVIDADTVLIRDIDCVEYTFFTSKERNQGYFEHFFKLFGEVAPLKNSAIANFMWFSPSQLRIMLSEIQLKFQNSWWIALVDVANTIKIDTAFSEYETYANWCALGNGRHIETPIHIFRRGDLLINSESDYAKVVNEVESKGYDAVAFEMNHQNSFVRRVGARVVLMLAFRNW